VESAKKEWTNLTLGSRLAAMKKNTHAKKLGSIKSEKKANSSRLNGALGGRRRKFKKGERVRLKNGIQILLDGWNGTGTVLDDEDWSEVIAIAKDGEDPTKIGFRATLVCCNELTRIKGEGDAHHPGETWVSADFVIATLLHNLQFSGMSRTGVVDFVRQIGGAIRSRVTGDAGGAMSLKVLNSDVIRYYRFKAINYDANQPEFSRTEAIRWPIDLI
jgi:hypothetical protein